jgi:2-keto-4-pentenoate hydratase/2-oxohepta-3-ene-1,7-dioic acid hydratase in catechol pathway
MSVTRLFRIEHDGTPRYALEIDGGYRLVDGDVFTSDLRQRVEASARSGEPVRPARILPPVTPSKVVAIGLNYKDHAAEMNKPLPAEPLMFMKPSTAVVGPGDTICIPANVGRIDYEAELGVVIGKRTFRVPAARAMQHVLGLTCLIDVTARDLQRKEVQYTRAKGFDTFAPIGPCVAIGLDPSELDIEGWLNGERKQASNTRQLIFAVPDIIAFVSNVMTLLPGDVVATGTPSGVGSLKPGDRFTVKIEGIGELSNPVSDGSAVETAGSERQTVNAQPGGSL